MTRRILAAALAASLALGPGAQAWAAAARQVPELPGGLSPRAYPHWRIVVAAGPPLAAMPALPPQVPGTFAELAAPVAMALAPTPAPAQPARPNAPAGLLELRLPAVADALQWLASYSGAGRAVDDLLDVQAPAAQRAEAARRLSRANRPDTIEALAAASGRAADPAVAAAARAALESVVGSWQGRLLHDAARHRSAGRRASALRALGAVARQLKAPSIIAVLADSAARDADSDVRLTAVQALAQARSPEAVAELRRLQASESRPELASALELALAQPQDGSASAEAEAARQPLHQAALTKVIAVSAVFTAIELIGSYLTGSVALRADAMHLAADLVINVGSLAALWLSQRPPNPRKTYGDLKLESLMGLGSAGLIAAMGLYTGFEAAGRLLHPAPVPALQTMLLACSGLLSNALSSWLLYRYRDENLNLKGAFLHAATDAAGSLGIIAGSGLILACGWLWADPAITFLIVGLILHTTWDLGARAWNVLTEAVPPNVDMESLERELRAIPGVASVYELHVWSLSSAERCATVSLYLASGADLDAALRAAKRIFAARGLRRSTVQVQHLG